MAKSKDAKKKVATPKVKTKEVPRRPALPDARTSDERICWRFAHVDHDGPWSFKKVDGDMLCWLMERLAQFETMKINELFSGGYPCKEYDVASLPSRAALVRLDEIGLADMTKVCRLQLQGRPRLYGFLQGNVFHIVWWDPDHEIWPSRLRHT